MPLVHRTPNTLQQKLILAMVKASSKLLRFLMIGFTAESLLSWYLYIARFKLQSVQSVQTQLTVNIMEHNYLSNTFHEKYLCLFYTDTLSLIVAPCRYSQSTASLFILVSKYHRKMSSTQVFSTLSCKMVLKPIFSAAHFTATTLRNWQFSTEAINPAGSQSPGTESQAR